MSRRWNRVALVAVALCGSLKGVFAAELPTAFVRIGNEREVITDARTGREVTFMTGPEHMNTLCYPTCRSWTRDSRYLLIESTRPGLDGTHDPLERQLLMADTQTGDGA